VSIVGRDPAKLERDRRGDARIAPISIDYRYLPAFERELERAKKRAGPIMLAVCWSRPRHPKALATVRAAVSEGGRLVHVRGTAAGEVVERRPPTSSAGTRTSPTRR
jgi:hypothetical protein